MKRCANKEAEFTETITFRLPREHKEILEKESMDVSWLLRDLVRQYISFKRIKTLPKEKESGLNHAERRS